MEALKLELKYGGEIPALGLGTWQAAPGEVGEAIISAIRAGYRHFDCAAIYGNEREIGEALAKAFKEGLVKREDIWVTSKLWCGRFAGARSRFQNPPTRTGRRKIWRQRRFG